MCIKKWWNDQEKCYGKTKCPKVVNKNDSSREQVLIEGHWNINYMKMWHKLKENLNTFEPS